MTAPACAADLLREARARDRAGQTAEAIDAYEAAIAVAEQRGERAVLAEALRRLAIVHHLGDGSARARELCRRSFEVAQGLGDQLLTAEALNTLGGLDLATGSLTEARKRFLRALELAGASRELIARVEQNLGILANIQGDLGEAVMRYSRSLTAYQSAGDEHGCAITYCNLGMASADQERYDEAEGYFRESLAIARRAGDAHLEGLCLVDLAEVSVACRRFEDARRDAQAALALFDQLGEGGAKSDAYRILGIVYRDTGNPALAESRLLSAIALAVGAGSVLNEAEASRELALLYQAMGRNRDALALLNLAHRLFGRLHAQRDVVNLHSKVVELESTYGAVVREWGQSIESSDRSTFGHCERVAQNAVAVAEVLGLDRQARTTIRFGAYLHDVGKLRVPHEILNKPGPLTREELALVQKHPIWGVELLASVEFPWDLKPIIHWHHERYDGTGYPDHLCGDRIPIAAQIVGIVDVYDALTTTRPYRPAMSLEQALQEMMTCQGWWSSAVLEAFFKALPVLSHRRAGCARAA